MTREELREIRKEIQYMNDKLEYCTPKLEIVRKIATDAYVNIDKILKSNGY